MSLRFDDPSPALRPSRALLHPLWLGSLAVLVLNDHVLKGASLLPSVVTGKLSDVAGLVVAPVLLAALCRVRSMRGLWLAHAAVGVVFSAIQLSAAAAGGWSAAMASIGFPWAITRDPTDLLALPALALSLWALTGAMRRSASFGARRGAEVVAAGAGLLCCAATSPPPGEPFRWPLWTDVYVHNAGSERVVVRMRRLAPGVDLDCDAVAEDPGRLVTEPLFGNAQSFALDPGQNFGLRLNNEWEQWDSDGDEIVFDDNGDPIEPVDLDCYAVLLDVDGLPPAVAFWMEGQVPEHEVPGEGAETSEEPRGRIELHPTTDPDTLGTYEAKGDDVLFLVPPTAPPVQGECAPQSDAGRLEWSEFTDGITWEVLSAEHGVDGCFALDLGTRNVDGEVSQEFRWYLCAPLTELSLEPGRMVRMAGLGATSAGEGGVQLFTVDETPGLPQVELQAFRGTVFPPFHGLQVAAVPEFDCGYVVSEGCGTVIRATSVSVGGGPFGVVELAPGGRQTLTDEGGAEMTVALAHSEERAALDPQCAEGPDSLGLDLEVVALYVEPSAG
ncbi:hypothetical protein [Paraliomyxa miuraensis]|uniref:hypothetical protein n=1 Tax=Paraliomyxa miuraensis TaxID=376150 RepID=UPI0022506FAC|nr:hypothetical protein [Paraliomyxa miuraensis]MCX4247902.1 hypothetical protein [Paraliomyxa miuraensis]